ncbi:MAG TPA: caspase family protein [Abditibacteriaceae bacterium]
MIRLFACLIVVTSAIQAQAAPKTWALIVGVSDYPSPQIDNLKSAAKDAKDLHAALTNPQIVDLNGGEVELLVDKEATKSKIEEAVLFNAKDSDKTKVQPGDTVLVFLAGHGVAKGVGANGKSYFLPHDARNLTTESLDNSAVNLRKFTEKLSELPASQFVLFIDACREDPTPGRGIKPNTMTNILSRGLTVPSAKAQSATFLACKEGQRAYEDEELGNGVFTHAIIEGLKKGAVPQQNGDVELGRLQTYVSQNVNTWAEKASDTSGYEIKQEPEWVVVEKTAKDPVLLSVKRKVTEEPLPPTPPVVLRLPITEETYGEAIRKDPRNVEAHTALRELHRLQGRNADVIVDAWNLVDNVPDAHALSVLSRAYSRYAESGAGTGNTATSVKTYNNKKVPMLRHEEDARFSAISAALEAKAKDSKSAEAHRAHGYALAALDIDGKYKKAKEDALKAFRDAVSFNGDDPANHLALGYGIRFYGAQLKDEAAKKEEVSKAITSLEKAVELRPDYYEAHRELAFCHTMLGNVDEALRAVEMANGSRGDATDVGEIAALEVAAAGMHQEAAKKETGEKKEEHELASNGYMQDAEEKDKGLEKVLKILNMVGLGQQIGSLLPGKWKDKFRVPDIPIPGRGKGIPGFKFP